VEIAARDAATYDIAEGEQCRVKSRRGELVARALVSTKAVPGTIFIPFHYYEAAVNKLTIAALDPVAKIPEYKVCAVKIEKVAS
jgi:predicted molibdopterin-dependent oxidoreductase YjgC